MAEPLVAVLAGGRSSRMGEAKATAVLGGRPLIAYPLAAAREAELAAVVVAKPSSPLPPLEVDVWHEPDEPVHPLCGLVHALAQARGRPLVAVAADLPFVTGPVLAWLAGEGGAAATVPVAGGRLQPLLARYEPSALEPLREALAASLAMRDAASALAPRLVDLSAFGDADRLTFNVNTPTDLARAKELLAPDHKDRDA
jgi:molybdenum cofactor guanylyltransferase